MATPDNSSLPSRLCQVQREQWLRGERVLVEALISKYPELSTDRNALLTCVYSEYCLRKELGESPEPEEYLRRFPDLSNDLSRLFASNPASLETASASTARSRSLDGSQLAIVCPNCQQVLHLEAAATSERVRCPSCGKPILVLDPTLSAATQCRTIGHFELRDLIGGGQFGDVWLGYDTSLKREVAIKIPRASRADEYTAQLFLREARAAASLKHPNIVPVHEVGRENGTVFIISDFIRGVTLRQRLRQASYSSWEAAELCTQLADALHHAHDAGIIHRDLKPGNVMIDLAGRPQVMDFGLAKQNLDEITVTIEGQVLGTPAYMSPEQASGRSHEVDRRSDVYSLGVVLYEMLAGRRPFDGNPRLLTHRILHEDPVNIRKINSSVPSDLETICAKAMAKDPNGRYATAADMADDLRRFLSGRPILARRTPAWERTWKWTQRNRAVSALSATLVLMILGIAAAMSRQSDAENGALPLQPVLLATVGRESPTVKHKVLIETTIDGSTDGAVALCVPLDLETGRPDFSRAQKAQHKTPVEIELFNGMYLVVVEIPGFGFHEVYRTVHRIPTAMYGHHPHNDPGWDAHKECVVWAPIKVFPYDLALVEEKDADRNMPETIRVPGATSFALPDDPSAEPYIVPEFDLGRTEVTVEQFASVFTTPVGEHVGIPGSHPATNISMDQALNYAEACGFRLPDLLESEWAATAGGEGVNPWKDELPPADNWEANRPVHEAGRDRTARERPILNLHSGALEWTTTWNWALADNTPGIPYLVRGGPVESKMKQIAPHLQSPLRGPVNQFYKRPWLGFRVARSVKPRLAAEDFIRPAKSE